VAFGCSFWLHHWLRGARSEDQPEACASERASSGDDECASNG
jgi:hypothetical protein